MGALLTAWQARNSTQRRVDLTNPDDETATTENAAFEAAAETDASNTFLHMTGVAFDATNTEHLTIGVLGLTYFLYTYKGLPLNKAGEAAKKQWTEACDSFARTRGSIAWVSPVTNSNLVPSTDPANALPYFDRENLAELVPPAPTRTIGPDPAWPYYQ